MSDDNFLVVSFPNPSGAYEAFTSLSSVTGVKVAAVVARDDEGRLSVPESTGGGTGGFWTGSLVGALVGIIGGPFGVLLGWSAGALIGSGFDWSDSGDDEDSLAVLSRGIQSGSAVLMVEAHESDPTVLDAVLGRLDGRVFRLPASEVAIEVEDAKEQAKEAAAAARKARHAHRRSELHEKLRGWVHRGN